MRRERVGAGAARRARGPAVLDGRRHHRQVRPATAGLVSELRLYNADGTFIRIASNRDVGAIVALPARPAGEELLFGIFVDGRTYKLGPGDRNPDGLAHAKVVDSGDRRYDVGFEDLFNGGDRDYDDNVFRFSGGLAPNTAPVADDQKLTVAEGGSLPITLTGSDADGNVLTFALLDGRATARSAAPARS